MSRVGKVPIAIPSNATVNIIENSIEVKGPHGILKRTIPSELLIEKTDNVIKITPKVMDIKSKSLWGTYNRLISNMIKGVTELFTRILEINGNGYKAIMDPASGMLNLFVGFSHSIWYSPKEGVTIKCPKPTQIEVSGIDKEVVNQIAAEIRRFRKPEPYKGKGIRYNDEKIILKEKK